MRQRIPLFPLYWKTWLVVFLLSVTGSGAIGNREYFPEPTDNSPPWHLLRNENGIQIYTRPYPGSEFVSFKSDTIIDAPLQSIVAMAMDFDSYLDWIHRALEVKILEYPSPNSVVYYLSMDSPWPITDRDTVNMVTFSQDPVTKIVTFVYELRPGIIPFKKDFIRIPENWGEWTLIPLEDGRVRSIRQGHGEPGGWLPAWMVNWAADTVMITSEIKLKKHVKQEKYRTMMVSWLAE